MSLTATLESESTLKISKKNNKTLVESEYKKCILIWNPSKYGLTILTMENAKDSYKYEKPVFYIPLRTFMRCGAIWSALNLSTIFWEQRPYHIERTFQETEKVKGAYLVAFASDLASICKGWVEECIDKLYEWPRDLEVDETFVEVIVFQNSLKDEITNAIKMHMLQVDETDNKNIFSVFET